MYNITRSLSLIVLAGFIALPACVEARAGGGSSFGSRGTRSYQSTPYSAQSLSRSTASRPSPAYNQPNRPAYTPAAPYGGGRPFLSSLAGGFLGAGLFHMFFGGGGGMGYGGGGMGYGGGIGGSGIGFFELLLLGGVAYFIIKRMRGSGFGAGNPSYASVGAPYVSSLQSADPALGYNAQAPETSQSLSVTDSDKQEMAQLLQHIQLSWSNGDISRMRQYLTPEMVQYFSEELSANASKGLANKVEQVALGSAEIAESWSEYNLDYATARMRWTSLDYMVRLDRNPGDADYIASGDNQRPVEAEEYWTFTRSSGGHWLLSAIQQL